MKVLTNERAAELLQVPKYIVTNDEVLSEFTMTFSDKIYGRYKMRSADGSNTFLMQVTQGKQHIKISLYFQEDAHAIGLFRVDYNAPDHRNPVIVNEYVPDYVKPYANKHVYGSHVHIYVQGYQPLAWAVPVGEHNFPVKKLDDIESFYKSITAFCDIINLQTTIQHEGRMFL